MVTAPSPVNSPHLLQQLAGSLALRTVQGTQRAELLMQEGWKTPCFVPALTKPYSSLLELSECPSHLPLQAHCHFGVKWVSTAGPGQNRMVLPWVCWGLLIMYRTDCCLIAGIKPHPQSPGCAHPSSQTLDFTVLCLSSRVVPFRTRITEARLRHGSQATVR